MLIAAAIVGLIVAYHLGIRPGVYAAAGSAALFLVAMTVPRWAIWAYAIVGVGVIGVCLIGPKLPKEEAAGFEKWGRRAFSWMRKLLK
jgi:hypothetical protein